MYATLISCPAYYKGDMRLYRLSTPVNYSEYGADSQSAVMRTEYVLVVTVCSETFSLAETLIYPANENGRFLSRVELPGSYRGGLDHAEALRRAGYTVNAGQNDAIGGAE